MGWKIVRDGNEAWCRANGVPGQWRKSPDLVAALRKKIGEEYGELAEDRDPAELYDLMDVTRALIDQVDPDSLTCREPGRAVLAASPVNALFYMIGECYALYASYDSHGDLHELLAVAGELAGRLDPAGEIAAAHQAKVAEMGGFTGLIEWTPVPADRAQSTSSRWPRTWPAPGARTSARERERTRTSAGRLSGSSGSAAR